MKVLCGDCLEILKSMEDNSVDLVFTSPPYEAARTYGIGFNLKGQAWVDWCLARFIECVRVSRGLVAWNVEGQTRKFKYSAAPLLLAADLGERTVLEENKKQTMQDTPDGMMDVLSMLLAAGNYREEEAKDA